MCLVLSKALADNNFVIIGALDATSRNVCRGWAEDSVVALASLWINATAGDAADDFVIWYLKHDVDLWHQALTDNKLGLSLGAAHSIENETLLCVLLVGDSGENDLLNHVVWYQSTGIHESLGLLANWGSCLHLGAKCITGGELLYAVLLTDVCALGALATGRWGEDADLHWDGVLVADHLHGCRGTSECFGQILEAWLVEDLSEAVVS